MDGAEQDPRDSAVGRLYTQYGAYFVVARDAFGFGVVSLLCATVVKTWAIFDQSIALPVSGIIATLPLTLTLTITQHYPYP